MVFSYWNKDLCFCRRAERTMHPASHQDSQEHRLHPLATPVVPSQRSHRTHVSSCCTWCSTTSHLVKVFVWGKGWLLPGAGSGGTPTGQQGRVLPGRAHSITPAWTRAAWRQPRAPSASDPIGCQPVGRGQLSWSGVLGHGQGGGMPPGEAGRDSQGCQCPHGLDNLYLCEEEKSLVTPVWQHESTLCIGK